MTLLKLIRFSNLLIVALTQYLLHDFILLPALRLNNIRPALNQEHFLAYVLVTLSITATGYIINDLYDREIDQVNRPEKALVGVRISIQATTWLYAAISFGGFILALFLGFYTQRVHLVFIYPLALVLLYWYSAQLKKEPLAGNFLVALMCAAVAGAVWLAEMEPLRQLVEKAPVAASRIRLLFIWYMVFAFLVTLYREIVKDLEDMKGDEQQNCRTTPIHWGEPAAKWLAGGSGLLLFLFLTFQGITLNQQFGLPVTVFLLFTILAPLGYSFQRLLVAHSSSEYHFISTLLKVVMLNGLLLLVVGLLF